MYLKSRIFDRTGAHIANIKPQLDSVSWMLNAEGKSGFSLAWDREDEDVVQCVEANIRYGNWIMHLFDDLPAWYGVIDAPRQRIKGAVTVTAYTGEHLLSQRESAKSLVVEDKTGTIFATLLNAEIAEGGFPVELAESLFTAGETYSLEYHYHNLYSACIELQAMSGFDFDIAGYYNPESGEPMTWVADWYQRKGSDLRDSVRLVDGPGKNVIEAVVDESGPIVNVLRVVGKGNSWGAARLVGEAVDYTSLALYGYREGSIIRNDIDNQDTLDAYAEALLPTKAYPTTRLSLTVADLEPGPFSLYDIGDIVHVKVHPENVEWVYEGPVRILSREWTRSSGLLKLAVEGWVD